MARTIQEIKQDMTDAFIRNVSIQAAYGITDTSTFDEQFSKVSIENIFFYIVASAIWIVEKMMDLHTQQVDIKVSEQKAHTTRWYRNKALAYQHGRRLIFDSDQYDNTKLTDEQIAIEKVVKHCAVVERQGKIYIKVAGGEVGNRQPILIDQQIGLKAYLTEIKDAGVQYVMINQNPDSFKAVVIDIYYNPILLSETGQSFATGNYPVNDAINNYLENLPFNGEYRNSELVDILQRIEGVVIPELKSVETSPDPSKLPYSQVDAKRTAVSGYMRVYPENIGADGLIRGVKYIAYNQDS